MFKLADFKLILLNTFLIAIAWGLRSFQVYSHLSKMAEAKSSLNLLFQYENESYQRLGHFNFDLRELPRTFVHRRYIFGFSEKCRSGNEILNSFQLQKLSTTMPSSSIDETQAAQAENILNSMPCNKISDRMWEAYAVSLPSAADSPFDIWKIDQSKKISHVRADGKLPSEYLSTILKSLAVVGAVLLMTGLWKIVFNNNRKWLLVSKWTQRVSQRIMKKITDIIVFSVLLFFSLFVAFLVSDLIFYIRTHFD